MYYCQDCGTPVPGNYCPNCGTPVGTYTPAAPRYRIYQDVEVKPRYSTGALILAGYLGFTFLLAAIFVVIGAIYMFTLPDITAGEKLIFPICALFTFFIAFLLYLPGIHSIRKYSPEGMAMDAFKLNPSSGSLWALFSCGVFPSPAACTSSASPSESGGWACGHPGPTMTTIPPW